MTDTFCSACGLDSVRSSHCTSPSCPDYQDVPR